MVDGRLHLLQPARLPHRARAARSTRWRWSEARTLSSSSPRSAGSFRLRREDEVADDGHVTSTIRQWDRRHWGEGGQEFALVVHRVPRGLRRDATGLRGDGGGAHRDGGQRTYRRAGRLPADRASECPAASPSRRCAAAPSRAVRRPSAIAPRSVVQRIVLGVVVRRRHRPEDPVVLVLLGQAPRGMDVLGLGTALRAPLVRPWPTDRFRLRASSKRRWRPFFTTTPCCPPRPSAQRSSAARPGAQWSAALASDVRPRRPPIVVPRQPVPGRGPPATIACPAAPARRYPRPERACGTALRPRGHGGPLPPAGPGRPRPGPAARGRARAPALP